MQYNVFINYKISVEVNVFRYFFDVLVWQRFGVPLFPICAPLFPIRVPLVPICVTLSISSPSKIFCCYLPPISRYFCKDSLMTPPPQHTTHLKPLYCYPLSPDLPPLQKFSSYHSLHFPFVFIRVPFVFIRVPFVFTRVPFVFTRVHLCSFVFHSCSLVFTRVHSFSLVFIRVPLVFTHVHSCSFMFHSCSLVFTRDPFVFTRVPFLFTRVHSCSFVFIRVHSCSIRVPICVVL